MRVGDRVAVLPPSDYPDVPEGHGVVVGLPRNLGERMDNILHVEDSDGMVWPINRKFLRKELSR